MFIFDLIVKSSVGPPCSVYTEALRLIMLGRIYSFKISGIKKGGLSEPSEPPLPTPLLRAKLTYVHMSMLFIL